MLSKCFKMLSKCFQKQEHRTQKLSKTKKHRTQRFFVLEHMSAPYSQSIHPKHIPKGFVVANLAVVRAHYCHFASNMLPKAFQMLPKKLSKRPVVAKTTEHNKNRHFLTTAHTRIFSSAFCQKADFKPNASEMLIKCFPKCFQML